MTRLADGSKRYRVGNQEFQIYEVDGAYFQTTAHFVCVLVRLEARTLVLEIPSASGNVERVTFTQP